MKNFKTLVTLTCVLLFTVATGCDKAKTDKKDPESNAAAVGDTAVESTIAAAVKEVKAGDAILLDVREQSEWDAEHFVGAVLAPRSKIDGDAKFIEGVKGVDKSTKIYTHCMKGKRASMVADSLKADGYNVISLEHTFDELAEGGFEIEKDE